MTKNKMTKNMIVLFALLGTAGLSACGQKTSQINSLSNGDLIRGIVNGDTVADDDAISHSTVIVYDKAQGALCTGTILRANLIVTAGHCLGSKASDMIIGFGRDIKDPQIVARRVIGGVTTESYVKKMSTPPSPSEDSESLDKNWGDIAVLKIEGGELPAGYKTAAVGTDKGLSATGATVTLAGYGVDKIQPNGRSYTGSGDGVLRKADVSVVNGDFTAIEFTVSSTQDGKGACHGDSGGPAYVIHQDRVVLVGVTSRAHSPNGGVTCQGETVYTSVSGELEFLKAASKFLESSDFEVGTLGALKGF